LGSSGTENRLKEIPSLFLLGRIATSQRPKLSLCHGIRERKSVTAKEVDVIEDER
jgi:hypothetical protein